MTTCHGAGVHAVHNGLTVFEESRQLFHGLNVLMIFSYIYIWKKYWKKIKKAITFFKKLELESSFKRLDLPFVDKKVEAVAEKVACNNVMKKLPFAAIEAMVIEVIKQMEADIN